MNFIRLDITIAEIGEDAAKDLADLHERCFPHPWSEESFKSFLKNPIHRAMLAGVKGNQREHIGFVLVRAVAGEAEILSIAVLPDHRRAGVAASLIYQISELLRHERVKKVFLEVGQQNKAALALYKKSGFTTIGDRKAYYKSGPRQPAGDALIMEKIL